LKVTTERNASDCTAVITVEVDDERLQRALKSAAASISRIRPIPGFRPGKAPYASVERAVGKELLLDQAIDEMAQSIYRDVLKSEKIEPYDSGKLDVVQKEPAILKFTIPTRPVVTLGDYKSIHLKPQPIQVTGDEVKEILENLRKEHAEVVPVTRPVQFDDMVTINIKGGIEGRATTDRDGLQITVSKERGVFPWLGQLVGANLNETRTVTHTYGDDAAEELRGKTATYTITVTDIKEPRLPALDDEFAQSVSAFENMEQLERKIRNELHESKEREEESRFADEVLDAIIAQSQISYPASMLDDEIDIEIARSKDLAARLGMTWEKYLQLSGRDQAAYRNDARPNAEKRLKRLLTLLELADAEEIKVAPKEIDVEIDQRAQIAEAQGGSAAQTHRALSNKDARRDIEFNLKLRKTLDRVVAMIKGEPTSGKIVTPEMVREEMRQREAQRTTPTPGGLITDPSQVRGDQLPGALGGKIIVPGKEQ
jgi:trigger factor